MFNDIFVMHFMIANDCYISGMDYTRKVGFFT